MDERQADAIKTITTHAQKIIAGSYDDVDQIFKLTDNTTNAAEVADLAEAFGMMSVKVEAREFALQQTIEKLKEKTVELRESLRMRQVASSLLLWFAISMSLYIFIMALFNEPELMGAAMPSLTSWFGNVFIGSQLIMMTILIRKSGFPLSEYGITLRNAGKSFTEGLIITVVVIAAMVGLKIWMIHTGRAFTGKPFIVTDDVKTTLFWAYFISAPIQEFIMRGVLQSSAERILMGRGRKFWAVLAISLIFGSLHTFYSFPFAVMTFAAGLLWGWMYMRHRTLVGVSLCHLLLGQAVFLLGFLELLVK
jgi:membrane protease YdiL (CAAX protease family)